MQNVVVLANDDTLLQPAVSELRKTGCRLSTSASVSPGAHLIIRDWRDETPVHGTGVPVLTVDLSVVRGETLADVVERVLSLRPRVTRVSMLAALAMLIRGEIPRA